MNAMVFVATEILLQNASSLFVVAIGCFLLLLFVISHSDSHFCNSFPFPFVSIFKKISLLGSQIECRYALMSYGIPGDQLPITSSGRIKTLNHQRWIKFQREKEENAQMGLTPFDGVDCPLGTDVRIGNAGNNAFYFKNTPGNLLYRELLNQNYREYEEASDTQEKTRLIWTVLEELRAAGGRMLVRDKRGWWTVANTAKCREKIAHDFRETRKKMSKIVVGFRETRKALNATTTTSSTTSSSTADANNNKNHHHHDDEESDLKSKKQRRSPPLEDELIRNEETQQTK